MSIIHVNHIKDHLEKEFQDKLDLTDVKANKHYSNFLLTRALAAYAVQYHSECPVLVAAESITDGPDDNGIDAVYYDIRSKTLFIVQSKWIHSGKGEPENGDVKKFVGGVKDLFNFSFDRFNHKILAIEKIIKDAIGDHSTRYQLILTYTGINDLSAPSRRDIDDLLNEFNDASEMVSFSVFNQKRLYASLVSGHKMGEPIDLQISLESWGKVTEPYKAFYGQVNGVEVYSWWNQHRNRLFERNIRGVLGDTTVNQEITNTLKVNPEQFWFFNNGITIICDSATKNMVGGAGSGVGQFMCKNISIVNGAQTVSTLGRFGEDDPEKLNKVYVPVRLIALEGTEEFFGQRITKATNTQNRVESRDFVTFDPEQVRIKEELWIDNIDYKVSRGDNNENDLLSSFDFIESVTALACASKEIGIVVQLKREISKLWENLNTSPYRQLFNATVTGRYVYNCVQTQRLIDEAIKLIEIGLPEGREKSVIIHGNRMIALLIFNSIDCTRYKERLFQFDIRSQKKMQEMVDLNYRILLKEVFENFENPIVPTLFKNRAKCELIYENIRRSYKLLVH